MLVLHKTPSIRMVPLMELQEAASQLCGHIAPAATSGTLRLSPQRVTKGRQLGVVLEPLLPIGIIGIKDYSNSVTFRARLLQGQQAHLVRRLDNEPRDPLHEPQEKNHNEHKTNEILKPIVNVLKRHVAYLPCTTRCRRKNSRSWRPNTVGT
jgi:hypothetical protein